MADTPFKHWCETCEGLGYIDETLGGFHFSNPKAECPDCDGKGYWTPRAAPAVVVSAEPVATSMACEDCDGSGEVGEEIWQGEFQPPERERCSSCDGSGRWSIATPVGPDAVDARYGIDCYYLPNDTRYGPEVKVQRTRRLVGPDRWSVRRDSDCLNKEGAWEWEPSPSGRDDDFLARCRFDSAKEAIEAALASTPSKGAA